MNVFHTRMNVFKAVIYLVKNRREDIGEVELLEENLICTCIKCEIPSSDVIILILINIFKVSDLYLTLS